MVINNGYINNGFINTREQKLYVKPHIIIFLCTCDHFFIIYAW